MTASVPGPNGSCRRPCSKAGGRVRAVGNQDYDWLFQLNSMPELAHRWRGRPGSLNPAQVAEFLWNNVFCQFVIIRSATGDRSAWWSRTAPTSRHPHRPVRIVLDPQFHSVGWPLEAAALFIDYLFETSDVRKLYSEAVDYNLAPYQSALDHGLVHMEGCLKAHVYRAGAYRDYYMFAIYRDEWTSARGEAREARTTTSE